MGGGFLSIEQWLQQQAAFKEKIILAKKNTKPPSLPKLSSITA